MNNTRKLKVNIFVCRRKATKGNILTNVFRQN